MCGCGCVCGKVNKAPILNTVPELVRKLSGVDVMQITSGESKHDIAISLWEELSLDR